MRNVIKLLSIVIPIIIFISCDMESSKDIKKKEIVDTQVDSNLEDDGGTAPEAPVTTPIITEEIPQVDPITPLVITVDSNIISEKTWGGNNIYLITKDLTIGSTLTIEPGAIVKVSIGVQINVFNGGQGKIIAIGTIEKPILFTSEYNDIGGDTSNLLQDPQRGDWKQIYIGSSDSKFKHCTIEYARQGIKIFSSHDLQIEITDTIFRENTHGIIFTSIPDILSAIDRNRFYLNIYPLTINPELNLGQDNRFTNIAGNLRNTVQAVRLNQGIYTGSNKSITLKEIDIDYLTSRIELSDGFDLTLEERVILKMGENTKIILSPTTTLTMKGKESHITIHIDDNHGGDINNYPPSNMQRWLGIEKGATNGYTWLQLDRVHYSDNSTI